MKNLLFDLGAVIYDIDFQRCIKAFEDLGVKDFRNYFGKASQHPIFNQFEKGEVTASTFRSTLREITKINCSDKEFDNAWNSLLIGINPVKLDLLEELSKKYRLYLLSNNNQIHYQGITQYLLGKFGIINLDEFFIKSYYSHLIGERKPDMEAFQLLIKDAKINPTETLYLDDSEQHIKTGVQLGFHCVHILHNDQMIEISEDLLRQ